MKLYKNKIRIFATAVSLTLVGLTPAVVNAQEAAAPSSPPPFVSALDAGVTLPKGTTLSVADKKLLSQITAEQFAAILAGQDPAYMTTQNGSSISGTATIEAPASLGSLDDNLVFTPIAPCRVIDTGNGNKFIAGETRSYDLSGKSDFTAYGGSNGACTLPGSEGFIYTNEIVRAWSVNLVAAAPNGSGNLVIWPASRNEPVPTASTLNFQKLTPNLNIANGVIVQNCTDVSGFFTSKCPNGDLNIKANFSGARVVMDITGYFTRANSSNVKSIVTETNSITDVDLTDMACHSVASCNSPSSFLGNIPAGKLVVHGSANFDVSFGTGRSRNELVLSSSATDCNSDLSSSSASYQREGNTALQIDGNLNAQGIFTVASGVVTTIQMNALTSGAGVNSAHLNNYSLICTYIPD